MTTLVPDTNEQQQAAIDARGTVFVAAGAGTGKTAVLVERFVTAVVDDGLDVQSLLVITYTERAAGELRARIRSRLHRARAAPTSRCELDGAWVSTIHGFCRRLLGAYPLAAGVDPGFRVLDEPQALVLQAEAFGGRARAVLRRRRARPLAAPRDLRRSRAAPDARRGLRDAALGGPRARARGERGARAARPSGSARCARRQAACSPTSARPRRSVARPPRRST